MGRDFAFANVFLDEVGQGCSSLSEKQPRNELLLRLSDSVYVCPLPTVYIKDHNRLVT